MNPKIKIKLLLVIIFIVILIGIFFVWRNRNEEVKNIKGINSCVNIYYNSKKNMKESNINYQIFEESFDIENERLYNKTKDEQLPYFRSFLAMTNGQLGNYLLSYIGNYYREINIDEKWILEYFDKDFFDKNNLGVLIYDDENINTKILKMKEENNICNAYLKNKYLNAENFIPKKVMLKFIVLEKNIENINFNVYLEN